MSQGFYVAISGIQTSQQKIDVISDNIANINTVGFKESMINFSDVYAKTLTSGSAPTKTMGGQNPIQIGQGTQTASINKNFTIGANQSTGIASDFYLDGSGFFCVEGSNNEILLTRAGNFTVDSDGYLVTSNGNKVLGADTTYSISGSQVPIKIPPMLTLATQGNSNNIEFLATPLEDLNALNPLKVSTSPTDVDFEIEIVYGGGTTRTIPVNISGSANLNDIITATNTAINNATYPGLGAAGGVTIGATVPADGTLSIVVDKSFTSTTATGATISQISAVNLISKASSFIEETSLAAVAGVDTDITDPANGTITYKSATIDYEATVGPADDILKAKKLNSYEVSGDGSITVKYSNGDSITAQLIEGTKNMQLIYKMANGTEIESNDITINANIIEAANLQLQLASVVNDKGLMAVGNNNYTPGPNAGDVMYSTASSNGFARIISGALESSNVDLTKQFAELIVAQRSIEANSRTFDTLSRVLQGLIQMGR